VSRPDYNAFLIQLRHDLVAAEKLASDLRAAIAGLEPLVAMTPAMTAEMSKPSPARPRTSPETRPERVTVGTVVRRAATAKRDQAIASACRNTAMTTVAEQFGVSVGTVRRCRNTWPELSADDPEEDEEEQEIEESGKIDDNPPVDLQAAVEQKQEAAFAEAAEMYQAGLPLPEIALKVGYPASMIANWASGNGWDRPAGIRRQTMKAQRRQRQAVVHEIVEDRPAEGSVEKAGNAFLRKPPPVFEEGTEPGWVKLPARQTDAPPSPLPPEQTPITQTPKRRCEYCTALTDCDPCHACSRPWIRSMSA